MENTIEVGALRVWWNTNSKQSNVAVSSLADAIIWLNTRAKLELNDQSVLWNTGGLELYDTQHLNEPNNGLDGFTEHYSADGLGIDDTTAEVIEKYGIEFKREQVVEFLKESAYKSENKLVKLY